MENIFTRDANKRATLLENRKDQLTLMREQSEKEHREDLASMRGQYKNVALEEANRRQMAINSTLYIEEFYNRYLTEAIKRIVSESLLLDAGLYKAINESYEEDVVNDIKTLLNDKNIAAGKVHFSESMKVIVSAADAIVPTYDDYVKLFESEEENKEDQLALFDKALSKEEVKTAISSLSTEVKEKVAEIVQKEQEAAAKDIELIGKLNDMNQEREAAAQLTATDELEQSAEIADASMDNAAEAIDQGEVMQKPEPVVQERYQHGIIEAFMINESKNALKENLEFNSDLALAKAIQFVTITETFSSTGLLDVTDETYHDIIKASGLYKDVRDLGMSSKAAARMDNIAKKYEEEENKYQDAYKPDVAGAPRHDATEGKQIKTYAEWKKEQESAAEKVEEQKPIVEMYTNGGGKEYTKSELVRLFENIGYDFRSDSFESVAAQFNYKKVLR